MFPITLYVQVLCHYMVIILAILTVIVLGYLMYLSSFNGYSS